MRIAIFTVSALLLSACAADVGEGRVAATTTDAVEITEPAPVADTAKTLTVDVSASKLGLIGAKVTAQHPIHFNEFSGEIVLNGTDVTSIHFVAQTASVEADDERLTGHLKDEDFLAVEQFPTSDFTSSSIVAGSTEGDAWTHTVTGNLTIRGTTKQVVFPAAIEVSETAVVAKTEFVINRQDFGVTYPGRADNLVQDNVAMQIEFTAPIH